MLIDLPLPTNVMVQCILTCLDADKGTVSGITSEITGVCSYSFARANLNTFCDTLFLLALRAFREYTANFGCDSLPS